MNTGAWTVLRLIQRTTGYLSSKGVKGARLDAELLLAHSLGWSRVELYMNFDKPLLEAELARFRDVVRRRANREPLAYILGSKEFWSLSFKVTPDVLIPRPETETLVEVALRLIREKHAGKEPLNILDIGTGCGNLAVSLAKELNGKALIFATDVSEEALKVSRENARVHRVLDRLIFLQGDLLDPVAQKKGYFHLIVSNPPYVPTRSMAELEPEVRDYEPREALEAGANGMEFICRMISASPHCLAPQGDLVLEIGENQTDQVLSLLKGDDRYCSYRVFKDLSGRDRVVHASIGE